ncbi:MAG: hypothetical protein IJN92_09020 [Lachnospiraceae bacterium]|nr:hypothetical protein [Lachnospiraceae bacterium]
MKLNKKTIQLLAMALLVAGLVLPAKTVCAGNSFQTASTFQLGTRVSHTYTETDQTEFYKFTTPAGNGYYSLTLYNVNNGAYKYISIYDSPSFDGSKVLDKYMYSNGNETTVMRLLPNRTYYIYFECEKTGESAFVLNRIQDDYGNTFAEAANMTVGSMVQGKIEVSGLDEQDYFRFTTSGRNSFYEINLATTGSDSSCAYIYEGNDASYDYYNLSATSGNTSTKIVKLQKNHTYYVKIYGMWDDATSYKFSVKEVTDDAGDDFSDATKITVNKSKTAKMQADNDVDFFRFTTNKKKTAYQLYIKNKSKDSLNITVYSNNDIASAVTGIKNHYIGSATTKTIPITLKKGRTYYIKIEGDAGTDYTLTMKDSRTAIKKTKPAAFKAKYYNGWWSKYAALSWTYKEGYHGYQIWRSSTSSTKGFKKIKTISTTTSSSSSYNDTKVKKGKTYYYKMRYYVKDNGKLYYSKWTKVKKVKIKK